MVNVSHIACTAKWLILILLATCLSGLADTEKDIPLRDVPRRVIKAARSAAPGITFFEAEMKLSSSGIIYKLEGFTHEHTYDIRIHENGTVHRVIRALRNTTPRDAEAKEASHD